MVRTLYSFVCEEPHLACSPTSEIGKEEEHMPAHLDLGICIYELACVKVHT